MPRSTTSSRASTRFEMMSGIRLKVCGLTNQADAEFAAASGADYLGFIVYPKSPRYIKPERVAAPAGNLKGTLRVAVAVEPSVDELKALIAQGFDRFQIHFGYNVPVSTIANWSELVGPERLWLAPKLPPAVEVAPEFLPLAETFVLDTFDAEKFGGTGRTGDWEKFSRHALAYPKKTWVLSGGLSPSNIGEALARSGAKFVDVNSGLESSPGIKDYAKIEAMAQAVARRSGNG
ncbi:MAG: phosphoribosylanthranilate isomerase [Verrucomicrobia bacterium]|nr:phosphoribosylanthranilate isomerase [Verrucomicrobiota bacterium]